MRRARSEGFGGPLAWRLLAAQALIVLAGALTLVLVAVVIAPGLFRDHLNRAGVPVSAEMAHHLNEALASALLLALTIAVGASLVTTLAVSWLITRRLARPIGQMAAAAPRVADGDYGARVPDSRLGPEFATLDNAFNRMAATLQHTEARRRDLLADLAHELRTPLSTVDSYLEGIEDGVIPAEPQTWRVLREQSARLRRLVDDVGNVSRAEEARLDFQPQPLSVDEMVAEAVRGAASAFAAKSVSLEHRRHTAAVWVRADPDRIREILDNVLTNALRHTPSEGTVTVTTTTTASQASVAISDTGEGIAAQHLPHLFDRFYRADPARSRRTGGSGIGLSIARALARAHGGELRAASDGPGSGATFTLTLPLSSPP